MRLNYLGPLQLAGGHPVAGELNPARFTPSCYLVEVSDEARPGGELMEGDVLVVDEQKPVQHADLVVVELDGEQRLFSSHRIGGRMRLMPTAGPKESVWARQSELRGVVVHKERIMSEGAVYYER